MYCGSRKHYHIFLRINDIITRMSLKFYSKGLKERLPLVTINSCSVFLMVSIFLSTS